MDKISRRRLAKFVADKARNGVVPYHVVRQVAGFLQETGRTREAELVIRAIEDELAARGVVVVDVTAAQQLTVVEKEAIHSLVGGTTIYIREATEPGVIGGVRVKASGQTLDTTIVNKLHALQRAKL